MKLFEEVNENKYSWALFYDLNNIPYSEEEKVLEKNVGDIKISKLLATGYGLNIADEEKFFEKCKTIRIFTKEIELALLSGDREMYLYTNTNEGEDCEIKAIEILGKYIYISPKEICSSVYIQDGEPYNNECFVNLKEYVLTHSTEKDGYEMYYDDDSKRFLLSRGDKEYLVIENVGIEITYAFVIYVLEKLSEKEEDSGYENNLNVRRIRLKSQSASAR